MICWKVQQGDILDVRADVLICSANAYLNLSGGVGGELLLRYGPDMQTELHDYLKREGLRYLKPGELVVTKGFQSHFDWVIHAVAIDAFYDTTTEIVTSLLVKCFQAAKDRHAKRVAVAALATGYGRQTMEFFANALLKAAATIDAYDLDEAIVCVRKDEDAEVLKTRFLDVIASQPLI